VPESKGRAKPKYTPPAQSRSKKTMANPPWFVPVMLGLMLVGLIWVVTFYITGGELPDPELRLQEPDHRLRPDDQRLHDDHSLALTGAGQAASPTRSLTVAQVGAHRISKLSQALSPMGINDNGVVRPPGRTKSPGEAPTPGRQTPSPSPRVRR